MSSVEIVLGEHWKDDLRYLDAQKAFRPADAPLNLLEIRDVVDLVVHGANVTACISEESIFSWVAQVMHELEKLLRADADKAILEFYCEPWELVLAPDGRDLMLSLYGVDRERRVVAHDVRVCATDFLCAITHVAEHMLSDLLQISDEFSADPFIRSFSQVLARLKRHRRVEFQRRPRSRSTHLQGTTSTSSGLTLSYMVDLADDHTVTNYQGLHSFDLHALLVTGMIEAEVDGQTVNLSDGYPFLTVQSIAARLREVLNLMESQRVEFRADSRIFHTIFEVKSNATLWDITVGSDPSNTLAFSALPLDCLDGFLSVAELLLSDLLSLNESLMLNQRFVDLKEDLTELRHWLGDFTEANLYHDRPEEYLRTHGDLRPSAEELPANPFQWPLADVRAFFPRPRWVFEEPQIHFGAISLTPRRMIVPTRFGISGVCVESGKREWSFHRDDMSLSSYAMTPDGWLLIADEDGISRRHDIESGDLMDNRTFETGPLLIDATFYEGQERLVVSDFHGDIRGFDLSTGAEIWHFGATHGYLSGVQAYGPLFLALSSPGYLHAFNPLTGDILWKVRLGGIADAGPFLHHGRLFTMSHDHVNSSVSIHTFYPYTGRTAWQLRLDGTICGIPDFVEDWMLLPLERHGRLYLCAIDVESPQPCVQWQLELSSAGIDRATRVVPTTIDDVLCGIVRTDRCEISCFEVETGVLRWRERDFRASELLFRNVDMHLIKGAVVSISSQVEIRDVRDGSLLHTFADVADGAEMLAFTEGFDALVGESSQDAESDCITSWALNHYLALVR